MLRNALLDPKYHIARDAGGGAPLTSSGATLATNILAMLRNHYTHVADGWRVWVNEEGGIVIVKNLLLSGQMGMIIPVRSIDTDYKSIVRYGGELLERYRIARAGAETLIQSQLGQQRDVRGNLRADV